MNVGQFDPTVVPDGAVRDRWPMEKGVPNLRIIILLAFFVTVFASPAALAVLASQRGLDKHTLTLSSAEFYRQLGIRPDYSSR